MASRLPSDAFSYYLGLGSQRSYQRVADEFGISKRAVTKRADRDRWQERLAAIETEARHRSDEKAVETLEEMSDRHLRSLRIVQGKALEALRALPLGTAMEAVRALDMSIKQERTIRGEPSDRSAISVEQVIREEYERWMTHDPDDPPEKYL